MTGTAPDGHPAYGTHYDSETGNFVMRGGSQLTPEGIYIDPYGERREGKKKMRLRPSDGGLAPAIPTQDGEHPRPLPPLVPTGWGWPTPPTDKGWPNLDNPNWDD